MQAVILSKIAGAKGKSGSALHASIQDDSEMHAKTGSKVKSLHVRKISMQEPIAAWDIVSGHWSRRQQAPYSWVVLCASEQILVHAPVKMLK